MAISEGVSCEICLRADEPESMAEVKIQHAPRDLERIVTICRQCGFAIARVFRGTEELPPIEEADNEP